MTMPGPTSLRSSTRRRTPVIRPASSSSGHTLGSDIMGLITRIADKAGVLGSIASAMGCAACFPALASLGGDRTRFPRPMGGTFHHHADPAVRGAGAARQRAGLVQSPPMAPYGTGRDRAVAGVVRRGIDAVLWPADRAAALRWPGIYGRHVDLGSPRPSNSPVRPRWLRTSTQTRLTTPRVGATTKELLHDSVEDYRHDL